MKTNRLLYILSLILLAGAMYLLVEYASNRQSMIAGALGIAGFLLNYYSYTSKK